MRIFWTLALGAALLGGAAACRKAEEAAAARKAPEQVWQCPMHPEIVREEPGECPICRMKLQRVDKAPEAPADAHAGHPGGRAAVSVPAERRQLIGVRTVEAERMGLTRVVRAPGRIAYDPELYSALEEHRLAAEASRAASGSSAAASILNSTRMKLRLLGLSNEQIERLSQSPRESARGLVLGGAGAPMWVYASVYEQDLALVKPGQEIEIDVPAYPGERFRSKVAAVDPVINPATRTARVRAELKDAGGRLLPEMYLQVRIKVPLGTRLAVPRDAVLDTGERQLVFKSEGENLIPTPVQAGVEAEGWVEIKSGLAPGERVVASANFLIDSEAQFKAAAESFRGGAGGPHAGH